jgi:hypothetical protein
MRTDGRTDMTTLTDAVRKLRTQLKIPRILWDPNFHYPVHKSLQLVSILSQINLVHDPLHISLRYPFIFCFHLHSCLPSVLFPSGFPKKALYAPLLFSLRATCSAYLILLDLIT